MYTVEQKRTTWVQPSERNSWLQIALIKQPLAIIKEPMQEMLSTEKIALVSCIPMNHLDQLIASTISFHTEKFFLLPQLTNQTQLIRRIFPPKGKYIGNNFGSQTTI